jgi:hypothetical protein
MILRDVFMIASPQYSIPKKVLVSLLRDMVLLRKRDFHKDAQVCIANLYPPLETLGSENIPQHGPCVITVNHYHRDGFGAHWFALAIASLIPVDMHWIMTSEFQYPGTWYEAFGTVGSKFLLKRIASVYGFSTMPPMPPREKDVEARAVAVRAVLEYVRRTRNPILGLAPEGYDPPGDVLSRPALGVGRFGLLLSKAGLQFVPVGAYEADGVFYIHFGEAYTLSISQKLSPDEKDAQASQIMMENIAQLLPLHLRGEFA